MLNGLDSKGWNSSFLGHNYIGQNLPKGCVKLMDGTPFNFTLYGSGREPYSQDLIMPKIRELKPDIFSVLLDTFMVFPRLLEQDFAPALSCFYYPSDGEGGLPNGCEAILRKVNIPVAMSKFAQQQVKETYGMDTHYIPHGVNINNFYKLDDEKKVELRNKWGLQGKFVVGTVSRNQTRKMLDKTVETASKICKKYPNIIFFMHTDPGDGAALFDIMKLITRYNLENRFIFSGMKYYSGFSYKQLNEVYNLMDLFILTTSGEGFGIPIIEAMACEVPVVATDYTTPKELIIDDGQCGEVVKLKAAITGSWNVDRGIIDVDDCAKKIEKIYLDKKLKEEYGKVGRKKVERFYTWDKIVEEWDKLFKKSLGGN